MKKLLLVFTLSLIVLFNNDLLSQTIVSAPYYKMLNWDTSPYKSFKAAGGTANPWYDTHFRLLFPKGYDSSLVSTSNYPIVIMLHGAGESALGNYQFGEYPEGDPRRFNNDHQLLHQGQQYLNAVNTGKWPGFVLFPQNANGFWTGSDWLLQEVVEIVTILSENLKIDRNRIFVSGLSAGAHGVWESLSKYPHLFAAGIPMSGIGYPTYENTVKVAHLPIWYFQGANDTSPSQYTADQTINELRNVGGTPAYTIYPNTGHDTWNKAIAEADFFPFMLRNSKLNIHVYHGKKDFCPAEPISARLGISPGFAAYEWKKGDLVLADSTRNELFVTEAGNYSVRFLRDTEWSSWSPAVEVKVSESTTIPVITASGSLSLPGLDGLTSVTLSAPAGFNSYKWSTGATTQSITVSEAGSYTVQVVEAGGCLSQPSTPKVVTLALGENGPAAPSNLAITASSSSTLTLKWTDNSSDESGFEVYRSSSSEGPYSFIALTGADIDSYEDLNKNTAATYYYKVRAINNEGASDATSGVYSLPLGTIVLYQHCNFEGYAAGLEEGEYTFSKLRKKGIDNDDLSSIKVKPGYEVQLFEYDRFKGASITLTSDNNCLVASGWNDRATSLKIQTSGVNNLSGTYYLTNRNSGLNLDVTYSNTADGTNIQQWTPNGTTAQQFKFTHLGNGVYQILSEVSGKSLDIDKKSTEEGANLQQWSYNGGENQKFIVQATGDGYYKLIAKHSGKIVDVANAVLTSGGNVQQSTDLGQTSGQWRLTPLNTEYSNVIQAEDYSKMGGVGTERTNDSGGGQNVGWIDRGDWMTYDNIHIPASGYYTVEYRVSSPSFRGKLYLFLNGGRSILGSLNIPYTGGWQNWKTVSHKVYLPAGTHDVGIYAVSGEWNINWLKISKSDNRENKSNARESNDSKFRYVKVYPNPAEDYLFIKSSEDLNGSTARFYNKHGYEKLSTRITSNEIDISSLRPGFYTMIIFDGKNKITHRFIKK